MTLGVPGPPGPFTWRPRLGDAAAIVALFALTRALLIGAGVLAWSYPEGSYPWRGKDRSGVRYALAPGQPLVDMWARWDSWEYEEIARQGYWYDFRHQPRPYGTVACFPFYPLVVRAVGLVLGGRYVVGGLVVSNLAALGGFFLLFQWAAWWGDRRAAWVTVASAITFPPGLFWSALYPQSLFFCLTIAAFLLVLRGRVAWASLVGVAVTATRLEGVAILPALLAIHVQRSGRIDRKALWLAVAPIGLLAYMGYLYARWGDPLLFLRVHALFGRRSTNPLRTLVEPWTRPGGLGDFRVLLTYATGLMLFLGHRARLGWPILLYGWLMFLIPLGTGVYESIYRIHLVNFPIYLALGLGLPGRWRILAWCVVVAFGTLQAAMMFGWVAGYRYP